MALLIQLHEQRGRLVTQAREALDAITANTDDARSAELEARHDTIMADLDKLDGSIKREARQAQLETEEQERRDRQRPTGADRETRANDGDEGAGATDEAKLQTEYRDAFFAMLGEGGDVSGLSPEQRDLLRKGYVENRTQTVGTNAAGGYTVPRTLAAKIIETMKDWGPMYDPAVTDEMMTSSGNPYDIPTNDDTGNTAASLAEGADLLEDNSGDMVFGQTSLSAYVDATPWLKISFELLQDSVFNVEALIARKLGERLGRRANARLTTGTGASQQQGIVVGSTLGKTAASATAIAFDEVIDLFHSVNQAYRRSPSARFMLADTTLLAIRKLKDGQGNYLWQMGNIQTGTPDAILSKPYSINDDVPAIATGNRAILFGDFSRYTVRKVGSPLIGTVRERFWPKVGMAGLIRYDGRLLDSAAIKHLKLA